VGRWPSLVFVCRGTILSDLAYYFDISETSSFAAYDGSLGRPRPRFARPGVSFWQSKFYLADFEPRRAHDWRHCCIGASLQPINPGRFTISAQSDTPDCVFGARDTGNFLLQSSIWVVHGDVRPHHASCRGGLSDLLFGHKPMRRRLLVAEHLASRTSWQDVIQPLRLAGAVFCTSGDLWLYQRPPVAVSDKYHFRYIGWFNFVFVD